MSEDAEDGLDLAAVRQQFVEAEERLRELAEAAVNLKTGSVQLKRARMGVVDASKVLEETTATFAEYLIALAEVSRRLSAVIAFAEKADPTALLRGVGQLDTRLAEARSQLGGRMADVEAQLIGRLAETEASLAAADRASRDTLENGIAASAQQLGESVASLEAALSDRLETTAEAVAESERTIGEQMERLTAAALAAIAEAPAARLERRRLRRMVWLVIVLDVLVLGGLAFLLLRGLL